MRALKTVTAALADRFAWLAAPEGEEHQQALLRLFRVAMLALLDGLGAEAASPDIQQLGEAAAKKLLADMRAAQDPDLAAAAKALGLQKEQRS